MNREERMNALAALKLKVGRSLSDFREVTDLRFFKVVGPDGDPDHVIELTIRTDEGEPATALSLRFTGIRGFHVKDFGGGRARIVGFDIESLQDRQLEGIRYQVLDYENDDLGFLCRDVEGASVEPAGD
jgi:hypothetical protein